MRVAITAYQITAAFLIIFEIKIETFSPAVTAAAAAAAAPDAATAADAVAAAGEHV